MTLTKEMGEFLDANVPLFSSYLCLITGTLLSDVWFNKIRWNFKAISNLEEVLPASLFVHWKVLKCFVDVNLFLFHHVLKISFYIICSAIWTRCQGLIGDITTTMLWQKIQKWFLCQNWNVSGKILLNNFLHTEQYSIFMKFYARGRNRFVNNDSILFSES